MQILPVNLIHDDERDIFGQEATNLARLYRSNLTSLKGFVVTPPEIVLNTILEHLQSRGKEVFEQSLVLLDKELNKLEVPLELLNNFPKKGWVLFKDKLYEEPKELYSALITFWLNRLKIRIFSEGFSPDLLKGLTPQVIFNVSAKVKEVYFINSYYDPNLQETVITSDHQLSPQGKKRVDELTLKANKILVIPQVYTFVVTDDLYITEVKPFTQTLPGSLKPQIVIPKKEEKVIQKTVAKVFMDLTSGFAINKNIDGVIIRSDYQIDLDSLVFKVTEAAMSFPAKPILLLLPDDPKDEVRGCLRLTHDNTLLQKYASVLDLTRNRKKLFNISVVVPFLRSSTEYLHLKKILHEHGFQRDATFKLWVEFAVPENIVNVDSYLLAGIDGVLLDLDQLLYSLVGMSELSFKTEGLSSFAYKSEVNTLIRFIKPFIKLLHKEKIPIIARGLNIMHPTILDFLLEEGVYGLIANNQVELESLPDHLAWSEKRMILRRY